MVFSPRTDVKQNQSINQFTLDTVCAHAAAILTEKINRHATKLGNFYSKVNPAKGLQGFDDKLFLSRFFEAVRVVYSNGSSSSRPMKKALLLYAKHTGNVTLREEFLGEKLFTDPELAEFAMDNLKMVASTSTGPEIINGYCIHCRASFVKVFANKSTLCGKCRPPFSEEVLEFLSVSQPEESKRRN